MSDTIPQETPQDKPVYIYTLSSPLDPEKIRYVGKTVDPHRRLHQHSKNSGATHRGNWLASLRTQGLTPIMLIVEETTPDIWKEREIFWIAFYRSQGHDLTNSTEGGDGNEPTLEVRAKISASRKGKKRKPFTEEAKHNMSLARKGKKQSPEHVAKRAEARRGSKHTDEAKAKMSVIKKGKPRSPETNAKIVAVQATPEYKEKQAAAHRGKKASLETKAKMAEAGRGRVVSPETREKLASSHRGVKRPNVTPNKGKSLSPETRAKISESLTGKTLSPETIEKRSAKIRGRKHSPEAIAKISEKKTGVKRQPFHRDNGRQGKTNSPESIAKMIATRKQNRAIKNNPPDAPTLWS